MTNFSMNKWIYSDTLSQGTILEKQYMDNE